MRKFIIIIGLLICIISALCFYYGFWPRYTFKNYGYERIYYGYHETDEHNILGQLFIEMNPRSSGLPLKKVNVSKGPYIMSIYYSCIWQINKIELKREGQVIVFSKDRINEIRIRDDRCAAKIKDINIEYTDYVILVYLTKNDEENEMFYVLKEQFNTNYIEENVSWFEIAQGI